VRDGRRAVSVGGGGGWWTDWTPIGKRAATVIVIIQWRVRPARTLQREEPIRQEAQRGVVVEAWPRATLEVVQSQLLL